MTTLPQLYDYHTGFLRDTCPKRGQLRRAGMFEPQSQTALFRGAVANHVAFYMHEYGNWEPGKVDEGVTFAVKYVKARTDEEGRALSAAVKKNEPAIVDEVRRSMAEYARRFGERFGQCEYLGSELPVRWTMPHRPIQLGEHTVTQSPLASHLDLLFRDTDGVFGKGKGRLICPDWKFTDKAPTMEYLARNSQFIFYCLSIANGSVCLDKNLGDAGWVDFNEWPVMAWIHLPNLKPYQRKTTVFEGGKEVTYLKGQSRPDARVLYFVDYKMEREAEMIDALTDRIEMDMRGLYPAMADPVGCMVCDCNRFCDRYDFAKLSKERPRA